MTDAPTCRPPPEFQRERWHWLLSPEEPPELVLDEWEEGAWVVDVIATPEAMAMYGFTYSRPCRPDDATVRAQLETENARLREALKQVADQFQFYTNEHKAKGADAKAETNQRFADLARSALDTVTGEGE